MTPEQRELYLEARNLYAQRTSDEDALRRMSPAALKRFRRNKQAMDAALAKRERIATRLKEIKAVLGDDMPSW